MKYEKKYFMINLNQNRVEEKIISIISDKKIDKKEELVQKIHEEILKKEKVKEILEISTKSKIEIGKKLSSFNLYIITKSKKKIYLESLFQSSKVFENGNQYLDLLEKSPKDAKIDRRLRNSGKIIEFRYNGIKWKIEPKTLFYDWLYINTLVYNIDNNRLRKEEILKYNIFTDIEFDHKKSINCQARSVALFKILYENKKLEESLKDREKFEKVLREYYGLEDRKKFEKKNIENLKLFE